MSRRVRCLLLAALAGLLVAGSVAAGCTDFEDSRFADESGAAGEGGLAAASGLAAAASATGGFSAEAGVPADAFALAGRSSRFCDLAAACRGLCACFARSMRAAGSRRGENRCASPCIQREGAPAWR